MLSYGDWQQGSVMFEVSFLAGEFVTCVTAVSAETLLNALKCVEQPEQ